MGVLVGSWTVVIETRPAPGERASSERFEVTPPPAPGTEREVLRQLVTGIHPGAVEVGHADGRSLFDDAGREIAARFEAGPGEGPPSQGTLFEA